MVERSPTKTALKKKAASVRDLDESEVRGVMNTAYTDDTDAGDIEDYQNGGWFMVNNPEFTKHKINYMDEVGLVFDLFIKAPMKGNFVQLFIDRIAKIA